MDKDSLHSQTNFHIEVRKVCTYLIIEIFFLPDAKCNMYTN